MRGMKIGQNSDKKNMKKADTKRNKLRNIKETIISGMKMLI